jgi:hypothetical protein
LATSACGPTHIAEALPLPPERLVCEDKPAQRPTVPPEYVIDWSAVTTVAQAHAEHDKYVATVRTREGVVAGYVLLIEGRLFTCFDNVTWLRDSVGGLPKAKTAGG